jgi:hypothetical protein
MTPGEDAALVYYFSAPRLRVAHRMLEKGGLDRSVRGSLLISSCATWVRKNCGIWYYVRFL